MFNTSHLQLTLSIYQVARNPYEQLDAEIAHDHWAISHVKTGTVKTQAGGGYHPAPAGSVMVYPPSLPCSEHAEITGIHEWDVFKCGVDPGLALFHLHSVAPVITLSDASAFSSLFDLLLSEWGKPVSGFHSLHLSALLQAAFDWVRQANPSQPLTGAIWNWKASFDQINAFLLSASDIVTYHEYAGLEQWITTLDQLKLCKRPIPCTERMSRTLGSHFESHLPVFQVERIGCFFWSLVNGRTQTHLPCGPVEKSPPLTLWFHDLLDTQGRPHREEETLLLRSLLAVN